MSNRRFGIEIECGTPFDAYGDSIRRTELLLRDNGFASWAKVGMDGTEVEIHSPILQGTEGFKELHAVLNLLNEYEFFVTEDDGMHIHHDAPEFKNDIKAVLRLAKSWKVNQRVIDNLVSEMRTGDYECCPELDDDDISILESSKTVPEYVTKKFGERGSLNVCSLTRHGSIEIRQHEGTLDYDVAKAWIKFGQRFIDECLRRKYPIGQASSVEELFEMIRNSKSSSMTLIAKMNGAL